MYLGFFVHSRLLCIQDELEGIIMDNYCDYWMLASPCSNYCALVGEGCSSLKNMGTPLGQLHGGVQSACPLLAGQISSCAQGTSVQNFSTCLLGYYYCVMLIYRYLVEMSGLLGCMAAQSELPASLTKLLNIQKFWTNVKYIHSGQHFKAEKDDIFCKKTEIRKSESDAGPLLCMK